MEACEDLADAGVAAAPCLRAPEVARDPHLGARQMMVEMERPDGVEQPVLVPGNPVRLSEVAIGPERRPPWVGEHTDEVLAGELGLGEEDLAKLRLDGVIG
jgi:crotonobetainyl-CoA:carnitine CoA-transferase CaiB-like acyl-CoA transferase